MSGRPQYIHLCGEPLRHLVYQITKHSIINGVKSQKHTTTPIPYYYCPKCEIIIQLIQEEIKLK